MVMAGISSLGIGSGVLTADLLDQLVKAERSVTETRLNSRTELAQAKISAYGQLRSALTELRLPMRQLSSADSLKAFSATSSQSGVSVSVDSTKANQGSYSVYVDQLAQAHSLATKATVADKNTTSIGSGKLTITVGDKSETITVDSSNNTLQGLANAINKAGVGASASVIDTGSGFTLVLSSDETGAANAIQISVEDGDGNNSDEAGLSRFAFNGEVKNLNETAEAQDAKITINSIEISRPTNTFQNVIDGLTFEVSEAKVTSTVKVAQDTGAVADRVQAFVDKFNALQQTIKSLAGVDLSTGKGSILSGDSTVRSIQSQLRGIISNVVPGLEKAAVRSLADVGISTDYKTGELQFDRAKFEKQLKEYPDDVTALFAEQGRTSDSQVEFVRSGLATQPGSYAINVTQIATQGSLSGTLMIPDAYSMTLDSESSFTLRVDGEASVKVSLAAGTYNKDEILKAIQDQLNASTALQASGRSVEVSLDANNHLTFTSGTYGSQSRVRITSVDENLETKLGLSTGISGTAGKDVAGTIGGKVATGEGQLLYLDNEGGGAAGLQVRITGGPTGSRGSITFIEGIGERTVNLVTKMLDQEGALSSRTDGLNKELEKIAEEQERLNMRMEAYQARLQAQFSAADRMIAMLNGTLNYVTQQLEALAPQNQKK